MENYTSTRKTLIIKESDSDGTFIYNNGRGDVYINSVILRSPEDDHNYSQYIQSITEIDTPEWKYAILDNSDRILYGKRVDNTIYQPDLSGYTIDDGEGHTINAAVLINDILINASSTKTVDPINGCYVIYFSSSTGSVISTKKPGESAYSTYEYIPKDVTNTEIANKIKYKRLDMMIDDDTSYSILRVNPKLTGNVKVVVDSDSNLYLDTFKVSLGLSQNKYRHISINPSEYYGRTLMSKMKSIPSDDFYKIKESCYDLFATANDFDEQYYDVYNYGVRTNTDKMYKENYALLAPLCIRKVLPDFFLIFKIKNYESLFSNNQISLNNRTDFINLNNCELIKSFDLREGTDLGKYIRNILENSKTSIGDVYTGYDYDHFNIFNGISLDRGVVASIYEETTPERTINNQVSMNDWYTLGFQRNHIVSKDIVNFEFMFDDTSDPLFTLPTYFGLYVRLNGEDETLTCIDVDDTGAIFDSSIHGTNIGGYFNPRTYPTVIYGISTPDSFVRLNNNIKDDQEAKTHKLETYKSIITVDTYDIKNYGNIDFTDGTWEYVSNVLNDVLDPGEHYRILDPTNNIIYEVIASNYFDDDELSDISYTNTIIDGDECQIFRIAILNVEYRSNIDEKDKTSIIKEQLKLITKAFNKFGKDNIKVYNDGESSFSILYKSSPFGAPVIRFEKVSSICGFNKANDDIIKYVAESEEDKDLEYNDKSSYIFGYENIPKIVIDPTDDIFESSIMKAYYPVGFESLGTRVAYCVDFMRIIHIENGETMVLVSEDIKKILSTYKTILYTSQLGENKIFNKNISISYLCTEGNSLISKETDKTYDIVGFGSNKSFITKFDKTPFIKNNQKLQFYQNFPMNVGICSIFTLKDYNFNVLDQNSVFFTRNENNISDSIRIDGDPCEYSYDETNVYNVVYNDILIESQKSEEFIADYCDKFRTYNVDSSGLGYMTLDSENDLGLFLSNMQKNGHNKFDISLISPYCCKWRILGTDMAGNRMRVMYNFTNPEREFYIYDASTWVEGYINKDGTIHPAPQYQASPYIDISQYKEVRMSEEMKPYVDSVGYFYGAATSPKIYWYWSYDPFRDFDETLLNECKYIRISINTHWVINGHTINYDDIRISLYKKNSITPYLINDKTSYWITEDNNDHIGYLSYKLENEQDIHILTKYISDIYDEDETGYFNQYICNKEGSIDDLLYRQNNKNNKFSKIYKYGDNSIEFVSCGVKIRIESTDKSMINLSRYVGYSVILIAMSGNNARQPGTYELFIDENKQQAALIVYNGIYSENNRINYSKDTPGTYRIKHSTKIKDAKYDTNGRVLIDDDGFISNLDSSNNIIDSKIFIISKPTTNGNTESIDNRQIILSGVFSGIEDNQIIVSNPYYSRDGIISQVTSQVDINNLINSNNNVDAYIITTSESEISTYSLSLNDLKDLTTSYSITIKTSNETKRYNNIASILSIYIVDPFEINRENSKYEIVTTGYVHPSYAVPVMYDILKFDFKESDAISSTFKTLFDGCNISIKDVSKISQTWMKKVVDIDNIMKKEDTQYYTEILIPYIRYTLTSIPVNPSTYNYIDEIQPGTKYNEIIDLDTEELSPYTFMVEIFEPDLSTAHEEITNSYEINDQELIVIPGSLYPNWKSNYHTLKGSNFKDTSDLHQYSLNGTYSGNIIIEDINQGNTEVLRVGEQMSYATNILIGTIDSSSNTSVITGLTYNKDLFGHIQEGDTVYDHTFKFDGTIINENTGKTMLSLRTDTVIPDGKDIKSFYFSTDENASEDDSIKFDQNYYVEYQPKTSPQPNKGISNLIHFSIKNVKTTRITKYQKADIQIRCDDSNAALTSTSGMLKSGYGIPKIKYENAIKQNTSKKGETIKSISISQSSSVTLLREHDPLINYWYTNMCRLFSKYDTYISYYGAFSGYEKNNYIASRGITLKTKDPDGNIIHGFVLSNWVDSIISVNEGKITLNVTTSIINFINNDTKNGYSSSWEKNQNFINSESVSYASYKTKYIENTILKLIDINNNTKFILYVDKSVDDFIFNAEKTADTSKFEEVKNLSNTLVLSENRYYMNIENLEPHSYYAEMIINF